MIRVTIGFTKLVFQEMVHGDEGIYIYGVMSVISIASGKFFIQRSCLGNAENVVNWKEKTAEYHK